MGVDVEKFKRQVPYVPFVRGGELRLFCCARLNRGKGLDYLIDAVGILVARGWSVFLKIAGNDESGGHGYRVSLEQRISSLELVGRVVLLGAVSEEAVRSEMEAAHVFVLPTLAEALGVAFMEAMAMEVPVVGTRVGGVPELIEDGVHGYLVAPRSAEEIIRAVTRIAEDPAFSVVAGKLARQRIVNEFSSEVSAKCLIGALQ